MSKAAELAALIGSQSAQSHKNMVINGAMNVAQRSTSSAVTTSAGYFTVDRFRTTVTSASAGRHTQSQATITDLPGFANAIKLDCTTADTSLAAGELLILATRFEGQDLQQLQKGTSSAKSVTVSFYAKGTAKTYMCELLDNDNNRHNTQQFTVSTSWTRHSITFAGDTTGALDDDNGLSFILSFWLHAGSTYSGGTYTANTWATSTAANRAAGIDSFFSSTDNELFITGVQMELGEQATPFEHRSFGDELQKCKRYYQKSYVDGVAVGTVTNEGCSMNAIPTSGNTWRYTHNFDYQMRATPTFTFYVPDTGTSGAGGFEGAGDTNKEAIAVAFSSNKSALYYSTSMDQTGFFMWHYELNAEL
jgi:hypothetical protein